MSAAPVPTPAPAAFGPLLVAALAPDLPMRLLKSDAHFALYAGLWSTWCVTEVHCAAKVLFATVPAAAAAAGDKAAPTPAASVTLADLGARLLVLQLQSINEDRRPELWGLLQQRLAADFARLQQVPGGPCQKRLVFDPVQNTHSVRVVKDPGLLSQIVIHLRPASAAAAGSVRPQPIRGRHVAEYGIQGQPGLGVFVEQSAAKHPLQEQMDGDASLVRKGTVLGAINEWRTWIVLSPADGPH